MEADEQEEIERVREWIGRLEAFASALDDIEGNSATDFANDVLEAMQSVVMPHVAPARVPSMLLALEAASTVTWATTTVIMDWADTPDVRDRYTRDTAQRLVKDALDRVLSNCTRWFSDGLPSEEEVKQRISTAAKDMRDAQELLGKRNAEHDAQDAEAAADPYGAILVHLDPSRSADAPIFEKVCSLTEDEDERYRDAYEQLRRMIDSELLQHISDESDRLCDVVMALLTDLRYNRIPIFDEDAWDEHRRKVRSALISFTAALYSHREQTVRTAKKTLNRGPEVQAVEKLFDELRKTSFEYGWLEELRGALQHGDINAFKWGFGASMNEEPVANVYMSREFMLDFTRNSSQKKWLKRRELEDMDSDPSVLDMIKAIQPLMGPLQEKLDTILYPNVADDVATVRELLSRYPHPNGVHALQDGPGFTRRKMCPPMSPLAPRVLSFVASYEPDDVGASDAGDGTAT
ncbi:hypothetical protein AU195_14545 [Mycobacterium sp. IS-1496]|uniref:Uncharacterized protein n=3 Tax=Mycolicibacterium TaxID=1866885 RepID=E6TJW9_MYCSR|nr:MULTISPECIES: hypothetical protein [Mycobacteriaceae]PQD99348.1 hypothetical protein CYL16_18200 [Mycobacterium sp. EPG1]GJF11406.1 hypothetical protein NGTWS1702_37890 [Mycolicibacterium sp. NGTWSNA01]GJF17708.1 hypothetical protein NGTWS0302_14810 [Mycolicibacterium sp. NGTWS0302]ADT98058.1 hypothetical protein Mspyr1_13820 [Mycolicibacterium gilvum Spyr1]KUI25249.1 hypothetical protein AU195_14545 [Mycobacterium sp. IS-1496]